MKIALFCFSATGNTQKIAELYKEQFELRGEECSLFTIPLKQEVDFSAYDMIGIGYPIHSFNAPQIVLKFAKKLPKRDKNNPLKTFIFKSSGEPVKMSRVSSLKLMKLLKRRGYVATNEYQYVMPYNMIFRHTDHTAYIMWETAKRLAPVDCAEILSGTPHPEKKFFMGGLWAWFLRCEHWGAHIIGWGYRVKKKKCISCGKCAKGCPVDNIKLVDGKPKFGGHCMICAKCSFNCPTNCINIGLLNGWKVNGAYSFKDGDPNEKNGHEKYCKKAYDRYFKQAEERILAFNGENIDDQKD